LFGVQFGPRIAGAAEVDNRGQIAVNVDRAAYGTARTGQRGDLRHGKNLAHLRNRNSELLQA
jgi:hypothetical protein